MITLLKRQFTKVKTYLAEVIKSEVEGYKRSEKEDFEFSGLLY